jgi:hypothetical protein
MGIVMDEGALAAFLDAEFPQTAGDFVIERVGEMSIRVRMPVAERHLRPGARCPARRCSRWPMCRSTSPCWR